MHKTVLIICTLIAILIIPSCYDENNTYGTALVSSSFRNVITDSCSVDVTSILIDSLETSGLGHVLIGQYKHDLWGNVMAEGYIPYNCPSYTTSADEVVVLDSLVLLLRHKGYYIGDTTKAQTLNIYRLSEKIVLNDNGYLYNKHRVGYDPELLGSYTYKPKPGDPEFLEIRLSDDLGKDLLEKFHTRDLAVSSERFEDYFKGIAIIPDVETSQSLLAFSVGDTLAALSLRYRIADALENEQELLFTPYTANQFSHIEHDPTGTIVEPWVNEGEIPSGLLDNRGFIMCGIGWYTKLEFPFLNNIMQSGEQVEVESATLLVYPESGTYSGQNLLPDSIYLYIADENNVITDAVKDYLGEQVQSGVLVKDDTYEANTYYYFDVTDFMQQELGAFGMYKHNLQLVFSSSDYTGTIRNMTFSDRNGRSPIVLQLRYKIYESY